MNGPNATYVDGSVEYVTVTVTADVELTTQPVAISLDRGTTWLLATWLDAPATVRKARTVDPLTMDAGERDSTSTPVLVRVTDNPETPVVHAGWLRVTRH